MYIAETKTQRLASIISVGVVWRKLNSLRRRYNDATTHKRPSVTTPLHLYGILTSLILSPLCVYTF